MTSVESVYMRIRPDSNLLLSSVSILIVTGASKRWKCAGTPSRGNWNQRCIPPSAHEIETALSDSRKFVPCLQSPLLEGLSFVIHNEGSAEGTNVRLPTASRKETLGMLSETERYVSQYSDIQVPNPVGST